MKKWMRPKMTRSWYLQDRNINIRSNCKSKIQYVAYREWTTVPSDISVFVQCFVFYGTRFSVKTKKSLE